MGIMIRKTCNNNDGDRECNVEDNKCDSVTTLMLLTMGATHIVMVILKKDMEDNSSDSDSESNMDDNDAVKHGTTMIMIVNATWRAIIVIV